eukprot:15355648-Ditylum_brightwellii.AAC.1
MSSTNQPPNFATKCMIEGVAFATSTDGWQTVWCDEISHQHLISELFLVQDCVVGCAQHNRKPIVRGFPRPLYTATAVFSVEGPDMLCERLTQRHKGPGLHPSGGLYTPQMLPCSW